MGKRQSEGGRNPLGAGLATVRLLRLLRWLMVAGAFLVFIYLSVEHLWLEGEAVLSRDYLTHVLIIAILAPAVGQVALYFAERSARREAATRRELEQRLRELSALNRSVQRILEERSDLLGTVELLRRELHLLSTVHTTALKTADLRELLTVALDKLLEVMGFEAGEVFVLDRQRNTLVLVAHRGLFPEAFQEQLVFQLGEDLPGLAAQSGQPVVSADITTDPRFGRRSVLERGFRFFAAIPIREVGQGEVLGTVDVTSRHIRSLGREELDILEALGRVLGAAIEGLRSR